MHYSYQLVVKRRSNTFLFLAKIQVHRTSSDDHIQLQLVISYVLYNHVFELVIMLNNLHEILPVWCVRIGYVTCLFTGWGMHTVQNCGHATLF